MPWLYQKYIGHDNNRDFYMQTQAETRVVSRLLYSEWLPQVLYNQHQGTWPPRIFVPPFPDPFNPNIDPLIMRSIDLVGGAMLHRFEREGKDGVISRHEFSTWYNGSIRTTALLPQHRRHPDGDGPRLRDARSRTNPADFPQRSWTTASTRSCRRRTTRARGRAARCTLPTPWITCSPGRWPCWTLPRSTVEDLLYGIYQVGARQIAKGTTGGAGGVRDPGRRSTTCPRRRSSWRR